MNEANHDAKDSAGLSFGIFGAGSIGCYLGANLAAAGVPVVLLGRAALGEEIREHGLRVTDLTGRDFRVASPDSPDEVAAKAFRYSTDPADLKNCDVILITTKSSDTEEAARTLADIGLKDEAIVISFQNGVGNARIVRETLNTKGAGAPRVLAGMVPYNVVRNPQAHFHCGTTGKLMFADAPVGQAADEACARRLAEIAKTLSKAGLAAETHPDLQGVLWGKLIFNLNNAVNALAGVPLREELSQRAYRKIVAASIREALSVMKAAGVRPRAAGRMIPGIAPVILGLPDFLFFRVAAPMVKIDPEARSSMWEDLNRGRKTEIDFITGEIVRLAEEHGIPQRAPIARATVALIKAAEAAGQGSPGLSAADLARALKID
ncbi:MAG: 2-dehydropantoate 2-reductase [bacterium]|nr:2-dehydropantoate 2-reductase [bacterium]